MNTSKTTRTIDTPAPWKIRLVFATILCLAVFYLVRMPFFLSGEYEWQMIPNYYIITNNPVGVVFAGLWVCREMNIRGWIILLLAILGSVIAALMTAGYMQTQPTNLPALFTIAVFYSFSSNLVLMPLLTFIGCKFNERLIVKFCNA